MQRIHTTFQSFGVKVIMRYRAPEDRTKWRQKTERFYQTLNPFNLNKETKEMKTESEIMAEVQVEADAWISEMELEHPDARFRTEYL